MTAVRKSNTAKPGSRQGSTPRRRKRQSARLESTVQNASIDVTPTASLPTTKQRQSSKNLSLPVTPGRQNLKSSQISHSTGRSSPQPRSSNSKFLNVPVVPTATAMPLWLLRLHTLHRHSSVVAFLLVAATLVVYGCTVYTQDLWSKNYRRLQNLQRHERHLTTTNATLTNKIAEEAENSKTGLVLPTPTNTIFLDSSSSQPDVLSPSTKPASEIQSPTSSSRGY
ncbi:hypothetical protein [Nostoc sp. UHCC 0870]|uniref:hypothetical protein n=1 Tax=Nostoc sp. UHCC 0870 TaxID=2914041 RepID=UPI001EDCF12C|nr:hypothetical protein [Nostoc sp. UHCC 0870]UKP00627.1 hypothetical protein L6494_13370 [Nostoc sp. UHCC 0870]